MTAPTEFEISVFSIIMIVSGFVYNFVKFEWNRPLRNGPGFYLGIAVPAGFYDGPGKIWLKGYRATLLMMHLALAVTLAVPLALRLWNWVPAWAGGSALLYVITLMTLHGWTRHKLGGNPPVCPVALSLETRRLGDYLSWPMEALMAAIIAVSWWLLLRSGDPHIDWLMPLMLTWIAPGFFVLKIAAIRSAAPLPLECAEKHYRYQEALRRNNIRVLNGCCWFIVTILFEVALMSACPSVRKTIWLFWLFVGAPWLFWGYYMFQIFRGERLTATLGRDLLPQGSFATPFRRDASLKMQRSYLIWFAVWIIPILVCSVYAVVR
jgi:hypothetical protein